MAKNSYHPYRIGQGYDSHALKSRQPLILGGVNVPHHSGLSGHSDADVLLHAIIDALFGAAALGDIGTHFPDTNDAYKGANSRLLLQEASKIVAAKGYKVVNVDSTIIAQAPRLSEYLPKMKEAIASDLGISIADVNVKAKTNEKLGFVGREEGIAAEAVVMLHIQHRNWLLSLLSPRPVKTEAISTRGKFPRR